MRAIGQIYNILLKDLLIEMKSRESILSMFMFGILIIIIFNFTFEAGAEVMRKIGPGIIWVTFVFAAILGLNRSFTLEKENSSLQGVMLTPVDRGVIYLGKFLSNLIFVLFIEIITLPFFAVFLNLSIFGHFRALWLIFLLGTVGFVSVGTLFSAMSVNTRMREVMLPILLFPVSTPVLIAAVESTKKVFLGKDLGDFSFWLNLMIVYDIIFLVVSFLLFEFVIEE
ncbi:MAG: heme exporter protein CcmB [Fidelibacterota bacterium]